MKIVFFGSPQFAVPFLNALILEESFSVVGVVTQPDRPVGRSKTPLPSPVGSAALAYQLPVFTPTSLKDPATVTELQALGADLFVVVAYGLIIPQALIDSPPLGTINVHPSLLPKFRGATPMPGAILSGDSVTGITIMKMDAKMDHGPILAQLELPLHAETDYPELETEVAYKGPPLLVRTLTGYQRGLIRPTEQNHARATYVKLLNRDSGKIDWSLSAEQIERMIRAYRPWPGTWTTWNGKRLKILSGHVVRGRFLTKVGTVFERDGMVAISCRSGALALTQVQLEGSKPTDIPSFLRGQSNFMGSRLGT